MSSVNKAIRDHTISHLLSESIQTVWLYVCRVGTWLTSTYRSRYQAVWASVLLDCVVRTAENSASSFRRFRLEVWHTGQNMYTHSHMLSDDQWFVHATVLVRSHFKNKDHSYFEDLLQFSFGVTSSYHVSIFQPKVTAKASLLTC